MRRRSVNKRRASRTFKKHSRRTKRANLMNPMRGGIRI